MTATTEEIVTVDGITLNTYAYNLATVTGRAVVPAMRGDLGPAFAYRDGYLRRGNRSVGPREETWLMWVGGFDVDEANASEARFASNLRTIMSLFGRPNRLLQVERQRRDLDGVRTLYADVERVGEIRPEFTGPCRAVVSIDLAFPFPWWTGAEVSPISSAGATSWALSVGGDSDVDRVKVRFTAGSGASWVNPTLTNTEYLPDVTVGWTGTIAPNDWVEIDTNLGTARNQSGTDVTSGITHAGAPQLMRLAPGTNNLTVGGTGVHQVTLTHRPVFHY